MLKKLPRGVVKRWCAFLSVVIWIVFQVAGFLRPVVWDLRGSRDRSIVASRNFSPTESDDCVTTAPVYNLTVLLPEGYSYTVQPESVSVWLRNGSVSELDIRHYQMTEDEAVSFAKSLATRFGESGDLHLSEWAKQNRTRAPSAFQRYWKIGVLQIGVRILRTYNESLPWTVQLYIGFLATGSGPREE